MKHLNAILLVAASMLAYNTLQAQYSFDRDMSVTFNWSAPSTLTPAYTSPDESNRSGEYVGGVEFTNTRVTFTVTDDDVKEKSRSARFYFGYNTGSCELRIYADSEIIITPPAEMRITGVTFTGPEVGPDRLTATTSGSWDGEVFIPEIDNLDDLSVRFYVDSRNELSTTTVTCTPFNSVDEIIADSDILPEVYHDLQGRPADANNLAPGLYICRRGTKASLKLVK